MYSVDWNNKFFRAYAVTTDKLGIDPLLDKIVPSILKIKYYTNHEVTQEERGAADLISLREYGSEDFWWHIMTYNGICRFRDIVEGLTLKIPDIGAITAVTNQILVVQNLSGANNIVTI